MTSAQQSSSHIGHAQDLFQQAMRDLSLDSLKVLDSNTEIKEANALSMTLPDAWLPLLMLRTDEIKIFLSNKRAFGFAYRNTKDSMSGMSVVDLDERELKGLGYPENSPFIDPLTKLISRYVTSKFFEDYNGAIRLKSFNRLSFGEHESEYVLPQEKSLFIASSLNDFATRSISVINRIVSHEQELSSNKGNSPSMNE